MMLMYDSEDGGKVFWTGLGLFPLKASTGSIPSFKLLRGKPRTCRREFIASCVSKCRCLVYTNFSSSAMKTITKALSVCKF